MIVRECSFENNDELFEIAEIERKTMGNYVYVETAWNYFRNTKGSFLCAYDGDKMVGIAHLAVLPDNSGWFEALRVLPEYQGQGAGKALYEKAIELCNDRYHCVSLSMYTGRKNVRSSGLAEKYGLNNVYDFKEYSFMVNGHKGNKGFHYVDWERATELALPLKEQYGDFISVNRTWYRINDDNVRMMADKAYFYENEEGSFVCVGSRFQHGSKLFVLMLGGNYRDGLDFAVSLADIKNIPSVTCTFTASNGSLEEALKEYGFDYVGDLITRERVF